MSVQFIAMVLIGGAATISGSIMGAMLIALLPRITSELPGLLAFISSSADRAPEHLRGGGRSSTASSSSPSCSSSHVGLFGIWHRIRTYWKSFPFSY